MGLVKQPLCKGEYSPISCFLILIFQFRFLMKLLLKIGWYSFINNYDRNVYLLQKVFFSFVFLMLKPV